MGDIKEIHEIIEEVVPTYKGKGGPDAKHTLVYESYSETLEPVYYFIIDLMNDFGLKPEKIIDNFSDTAGGTHFSETGMKASRMQDEAMKIMQSIGIITKGILQNIHDLKDFKLRLQTYVDLKSKDKETGKAANLTLKQIWLDKVDIIKGGTSIKGMAMGQVAMQTLWDAFLVVNNEKDVVKVDLNERIKRILMPRILEYNRWVKESERELSKRYEIQKTFLRSQVNNLKLYTRWAKPYLRAAQDLESKESGRRPELVKTFNRVILELTLLGKSKISVEDAAIEGDMPKDFKNLKTKRDYHSCVLVDFNFRAVPQQGNFIGRAEVTFRAYALNDDELNKIEQTIEESDMADALRLIEGTTTESLEQMQEEIDLFLEEPDEKAEEKKKSKGSNPFLALVGGYDGGKKKEKKKEKGKEETSEKVGKIKKDDWIEKTYLRKLAKCGAEGTAFSLFDIYKKAHGMASYT